jgi:hypothetical protein
MDPVERVKNMVRHTLVLKPDVSNRELLSRAREIAPDAVEGLSLRQFHGKFRLPIVRFEMGPRKAKSNGAPKAETAESKTETKAGPAASKPTAAPAGRKRGRKKAAAATAEIGGAVRDVLIDFAVELEKAESRSELVSVIAGVDAFVKRIVTVADDAYAKRSNRSAA